VELSTAARTMAKVRMVCARLITEKRPNIPYACSTPREVSKSRFERMINP
jgi:hypothetical protein